MRLDHLLSKEKVGVEVILSCQATRNARAGRITSEQVRESNSTGEHIARAIIDSKRSEEEMSISKKYTTKNFLVAMRLGDTPVPIPNTMVKT